MNESTSLIPAPRSIPNGSIVRLLDGTIAEQFWHDSTEAHVIHGDLRAIGAPGAGPWIFATSQLELATDDERASYLARCKAIAAHRLAPDMSEVWTMGEWAEKMGGVS